MSLKGSENTRQPRTFKLDSEEILQAPESIEGKVPQKPVANQDFDSSRRNSSIRLAIVALGALFALLLAYDMATTVTELWSLHWSIGGAALLTMLILIGLSVRGLYRWLWGGQSLRKLHSVQAKFVDLSEGERKSQSAQLLNELGTYYQDSSHRNAFNQALESLPDYLDGSERIQQFERVFLGPIDEQVQDLIRKHSVQTGVAVAASPLPALDLLLTLWRNLQMISEVAQLYGIQPSFANRLKILYLVFSHLAYVGLTEVSLDSFDLTDLPILKGGGRVAQGFGSAVATVRIGLEARRVCRPIPEDKASKGLLKQLVKTVVFLLGKRYAAP